MDKIEFNEDKQFTVKGYVEKNLVKLYNKKIVEDDEQMVVLIVSKPGKGKSSLTLQIQKLLNGDINLDWCAINHEQYYDISTSLPKNKVIWYDEGRNSFLKKNTMKTENKKAHNMLNQYRSFNNVHLINFQHLYDFPEDILKYNVDAVLRITHKNPNGKIARVWGYSSQSIDKRVNVNKKLKTIDWGKPDFKDDFYDAADKHPELWKKYDQRKTDWLKTQIEDDEEDDEPEEDDIDSEKFYSVSTFAEKLDVDGSTVRRWISNDKLNSIKLKTGSRRIPKSEYEKFVEG